jgi:hypothetical protein
MKIYISFLLIFIFLFFVGCSNSNVIDVPKEETINSNSFVNDRQKKKMIVNKQLVVEKKVDNYDIAMSYRRKLWINGIDYIPWKNHLAIDVILMPKLLELNKKDIRDYCLDKYKIVATKGKTFFSSKSSILFINYKSNINFIKKFAFKNFKYIQSHKKGKHYTKIKSATYERKAHIFLKSSTIKGAYRLQNELNKLYSSEIIRYNLVDYSIIAIPDGQIYKKGKNIYMPVDTLYQEMLSYFQKTDL